MYNKCPHGALKRLCGQHDGLIEGIADYTVLKVEYYPPEFRKLGSGERWDHGYNVTARFLEHCDRFRPGFVAALNRKTRDKWSLDYFVELVGKPVYPFWRESEKC